MKLVYYTDGGCEPNPGKGTWAFICKDPYHEQSGFDVSTTNNRMEMMAVLNAIEHATQMTPESIVIFCDNKYVVNGFNSWMRKWAKKGWIISGGEPVKNLDIWRQLWQYRKIATLEWVRGHNGDEFNELADQLVRTEYEKTFGGQMKY
jgi:ribonuclease HI